METRAGTRDGAAPGSGPGAAARGGGVPFPSTYNYSTVRGDRQEHGGALALAHELQAAGLAPIPILAGTKRPAVSWGKWRHTGPSEAELPGLFGSDGLTVGVLCGQPSDRLLVLDCDSERIFDDMMASLHSPATWLVKTARGAHVYFRTPVPCKSARLPGLDVKAQGGYVLAPGATHPSGAAYTFLQRTATILELPSLFAIPGVKLEPAPAALPRKAVRILRGDCASYTSRSEAEMAAVCSLIRHGLDFTRILGVFMAWPGPGKFAELCARNFDAARDYLWRTFASAETWLAEHPSPAIAQCEQMRAWALGTPWPGRTGATDRAVYLAHVDLARRACTLTYAASARDLAERAGVYWQTAATASHRLTGRDLLTLETPACATCANVWRLRTRRVIPTLHHVGSDEVGGLRDAAHDAFRRRGGKSDAEVWGVLVAGDAVAAEIAAKTGRSRGTVWRVLRELAELGAVVRCAGNIYSLAPGADLDAMAARLGTAGAGDRQHRKHQRERTAHRNALERGGAQR